MTLPKTKQAKDDTTTATANDDATTATTTANDDTTTTTANDDTATANDDANMPVDLGKVLGDFMASMREVQASVRADRERIEAIQLANGMVIRQGAPAEVPPATPPDDSYVDPAQFDPSNFDFKI